MTDSPHIPNPETRVSELYLKILSRKPDPGGLKHYNFKPIFVDGMEQFARSFSEFVQIHANGNDHFVITTRLDNDDLVNKGFIGKIQELFQPNHGSVIDLRSGYQISIERETAEIREINDSFNQFVSLVEDIKGVRTVLSRMHREWVDKKTVIPFSGKRMWITLVHDKNLLNRMNRLSVPVPDAGSSRFRPNSEGASS